MSNEPSPREAHLFGVTQDEAEHLMDRNGTRCGKRGCGRDSVVALFLAEGTGHHRRIFSVCACEAHRAEIDAALAEHEAEGWTRE